MPTDTANASAKVDISTLYTPGQLDVLAHLRELQGAQSDAQFVQKHLTVSATTWSRINAGTYAADPGEAFVKLEGNLRQLRIERAQAAKLIGGAIFAATPSQIAVIEAITAAKLKPEHDCERLVAFLGEPGAGKTALGRQLKVMHDAILVEGSEPWRTSYYAAVKDIAAKAGISAADLGRSVASAQTELLKRLKVNRRVLVIDEGEYLGQAVTNLLKLILNQTSTVVVLLTLPVLWDRWAKSTWTEASQVIRRAEAVVTADKLLGDDVAKIAAGRVEITGGRPGASWAEVAKAANEFGRLSLVNRVVNALQRDGKTATPEDVTQAIRITKAMLTPKKEGV